MGILTADSMRTGQKLPDQSQEVPDELFCPEYGPFLAVSLRVWLLPARNDGRFWQSRCASGSFRCFPHPGCGLCVLIDAETMPFEEEMPSKQGVFMLFLVQDLHSRLQGGASSRLFRRGIAVKVAACAQNCTGTLRSGDPTRPVRISSSGLWSGSYCLVLF